MATNNYPTLFRGDFYSTDRAYVALKDALEMRALGNRVAMRIFARDAVREARKYRRGRI